MSLKNAMKAAKDALTAANAPYALIGGMALSVHGYVRATNDIDFLVHSDFRDLCEKEMLSRGFNLDFSSDEVAHWVGEAPVDFLYARREVSREMLVRARNLGPNQEFLGIPVLDVSDIIGLKIQAYSNNARRLFQDLADIQKLIEIHDIDWVRVKKYAEAFNEWERIKSLGSSKAE